MKSPKNKTIGFSVEDGKPFLDRCITVTSKLSIEELLDRTILGDSLQVLEFLPQQSIDLLIADPCYNLDKNFELKACLTGLGLLYTHKVMNNENIVIDRDLLSNFSFNGTKESLPLFEALIKMGVYPDISFLLYASQEELTKRIIKRNPNDSDLTDPDVINQSYKKIMKFAKIYKLPVIVIDTNEKTEEQVFEEIKKRYKEAIKEYGDIESSR